MDSKGSDVVGKMYITGMQDILPVNSCNSSFSWILGTHCPALSLPTLLIRTLLTYNINWSWKRTNCDLQVIQTTNMISTKNRRQKKIQKIREHWRENRSLSSKLSNRIFPFLWDSIPCVENKNLFKTIDGMLM